MSRFDHWIEQLARRVRWGEFLHRVANWLAVYLVVVGTLVLLGKLILPQEYWPGRLGGEYQGAVVWLIAICLLGGGVPVCVTWWLSRQCRMNRTDLVAYLDRRLDAGGLLMTLSEAPDDPKQEWDSNGDWAGQLPAADVAWRSSLPMIWPLRFGRHLVIPVTFLLIACMIPWRVAHSDTLLRDTVGQRETEELVALLEKLKEVGVLEQQEEKQLEAEIRQLAEDTKHQPLTHEKWETVDTLREKMQMQLDAAAMSIEKALEAIEALESVEFSEDGVPLDGEHEAQLRKDIEEALRKLGGGKVPENLPESLKDLSERLRRQNKSGKRQNLELPKDAAERQKTLEDLQQFLEQESTKLEQLRQQAQRNPGGT